MLLKFLEQLLLRTVLSDCSLYSLSCIYASPKFTNIKNLDFQSISSCQLREEYNEICWLREESVCWENEIEKSKVSCHNLQKLKILSSGNGKLVVSKYMELMEL